MTHAAALTIVGEALGHYEQQLRGYLGACLIGKERDRKHADESLGAARDQLAFALAEVLRLAGESQGVTAAQAQLPSSTGAARRSPEGTRE